MTRCRKLALGLAVATVVGAGTLYAIDRRVGAGAKGLVVTRVDNVPAGRVGLVLGTVPTLRDGRPNAFFTRRVEAAAELYAAGRVTGLLISGDHGRASYNEPQAFVDALVARGVPREHLTCDYAGFRTLDSVVRAREVFGQQRVVVISQRFHVERALYLAAAHGIDAVGFAARDVSGASGGRVRLRETAARAAAWLDVSVLGRGPRFLGPPVAVGRRSSPL